MIITLTPGLNKFRWNVETVDKFRRNHRFSSVTTLAAVADVEEGAPDRRQFRWYVVLENEILSVDKSAKIIDVTRLVAATFSWHCLRRLDAGVEGAELESEKSSFFLSKRENKLKRQSLANLSNLLYNMTELRVRAHYCDPLSGSFSETLQPFFTSVSSSKSNFCTSLMGQNKQECF